MEKFFICRVCVSSITQPKIKFIALHRICQYLTGATLPSNNAKFQGRI